MFAYDTYPPPLADWDVSNVETFTGMFQNCRYMREDISRWNVSSAVSFDQMFAASAEYNRPLSSWDTSQAVSMRLMFANAQDFNQYLAAWQVGNVEDFFGMFQKMPQPLIRMRKDANTALMFANTACPERNTPVNLSAVPPGPLCVPCE